MIGSIIGAGMKIGGAIFGGAAAAKAAKEQNRIISDAENENKTWYNRRYNEDFTKRADAIQSMTYAKQQADNLYSRTAGASAVTGATDEAAALQKDAGNRMIADTTASIASQADTYKQGIENQYLAKRSSLEQMRLDTLRQKANSIQSAAAGVGEAGSAIASATGNGLFKK
ncbi:MAG: hypothetical protein RR313_01755 [Anaerovoracaceae bacterium]